MSKSGRHGLRLLMRFVFGVKNPLCHHLVPGLQTGLLAGDPVLNKKYASCAETDGKFIDTKCRFALYFYEMHLLLVVVLLFKNCGLR
jgi:hypothetical protein